jgi:hypothetical protein
METFKRKDVAGMLVLMHDDCTVEDHFPAPDGTTYKGKEAIRGHLQWLIQDSPEGHLEIEDAYGMGFHGFVQWRYEWMDGTGTPKHIRGLDVFQFQERLICKILSYVKG